jgi:hypothetical protein
LCKSQHRKHKYYGNRKKQGNISLPKVNNSTIKELNDSEADRISNNELKRKMIRIINEIKERHVKTPE